VIIIRMYCVIWACWYFSVLVIYTSYQ